MAKILIVAHARDRFAARGFLVRGLFEHWAAAGHEVIVHEGPRGLPEADIALLHVDGTVVPREYTEALAHVPVVLNRAVVDISKRAFSENLVAENDGFAGPVIVKTNLNCGGIPELLHARAAAEAGERPAPVRAMRDAYPIYDSARLVPRAVFCDPDLVVERFLPERDPRGYAVRYWVFCGDRERCSRYVEERPIVKGDLAVERTAVPVPAALRAWRSKLGFDYGKFDFVIHDGKPVLLDVNRTPTLPPNLSDAVRAQQKELAEGIGAFLR